MDEIVIKRLFWVNKIKFTLERQNSIMWPVQIDISR